MFILKSTAQQIFYRTLAAIDVESVVRSRLQRDGEWLQAGDDSIDLGRFEKVLAIAVGKASLAMARAAEAILDDRIFDGLVITNEVNGARPKRLPVLIGGHPTPNAESFAAAARALKLLRENDGDRTFVLFLISGGGSAMFESPIDERLTLADLQAVNRALVNCGAVINEMNIVRRRLSAVKGGRLAAAAPRSRQISLYISDVNHDDLTTVASGPTLPDASTPADLNRVIGRYRLLPQFPVSVRQLIETDALPATPFADQQSLSLRSHHLLLDNRRALLEAKKIAERDFGFVVEIAEDLIEGEVEAMAQLHLERLQALRARSHGKPVCLLSGGEATCPVRGMGQGGRNQEFVLRAAIHLDRQKLEDVVVLSAGTDGIDGHSPAAGAVADGSTIERAINTGLSAEEYLTNSDSFNFLSALGDAIVIGPTGNNVRDVRILLAS